MTATATAEQPLLHPAPVAARLVGMSPRTLWSLTAPRGPIPVVRAGAGRAKGTRLLYSEAALRRWIEQQEQASLAAAE